MNDLKIAVVGAGSIGVSFAILFANAGFKVTLWDPVVGALPRAEKEIRQRIAELERHNIISKTDVPEIFTQINYSENLFETVNAAQLVQECAPERVEIKQDLFRQLVDLTGSDTVLASSSSALTPSSFSAALENKDRIIVGHPGNPPFLIPVIEVVPSEFTRADIVISATEIYSNAGLSPVLVRKEVEGFIFNRLQGAVLREAYALVRDGVATVEDIDIVMRDGLGRRWCFMGPFETVDLNTRGGIESHAEKMGPAYARMGAERGQHDLWTTDLVAKVSEQRRALVPLEDWASRVRWRDEELMNRPNTLKPKGS